MNTPSLPRRHFIRSSAFGLIGITAFGHAAAEIPKTFITGKEGPLFYRYPSMDDKMVSGIVGASHRDLEKVKEMLKSRPELANAGWDWGFGDWETALGAASHVGRRDIAELLIGHGARPDIFTFAMLGAYKSLEEIVETVPGIQSKPGPHGITLLQHAKNRLSDKSITAGDKVNVEKVISYLEKIGNADVKSRSMEMSDEEKQQYVGDYRFGQGEGEVFSVGMNSMKWLHAGRKGTFGNRLHKVGEHSFSPAGAPSVTLVFKMENDKAVSFSIHEPEPLVMAVRV